MKVLGLCLVVLLIPAHAWSVAAADVSTNDVRLQAKSDAESEASRDITAWNAVACLGASACVSSVAGLSFVVGVFTAASPEGYMEGTVSCMSFSACALISSNVLIRIYGGPSTPPPERFIGKSPEYVGSYADAYKARIRSERTRIAMVGSVSGFVVGAAYALSFVPDIFTNGTGPD